LVPQNEAYRTAEVEERDYEDRSLQSTIVWGWVVFCVHSFGLVL
jgi:hypothetical protein